jgi:hypothetical protein
MGNNGRQGGEKGDETVCNGLLSRSPKLATIQHLDQKKTFQQSIKISTTQIIDETTTS